MAHAEKGDYAKYKGAGRCVRCGKLDDRISAGYSLCERCWSYQREYYRQRRADNLSKGLCGRCGKRPAVTGNTLCAECAEKQKLNDLRCRTKKERQNGTENTKDYR